ncbi:MAG TPA: MotA/TolQ/ExbB proton channel family protein, partial [Burkholderiales bacterium]
FLDAFWNAASIPAVEKYIGEVHPEEPFSHLAWHAINSSRHHQRHGADKLDEAGSAAEFLTRAMRRVIDEDTARLESGLTVLASVGSTAPFIGLFGTVWGVYHALVNIGLSGQGTLDKVAGPVGEALIMTALGLAVAIPAVLAYNTFVRANRLVLAQLDSFAHDLYSVLVTGALVGERGTIMPVKPALAAAGARGN